MLAILKILALIGLVKYHASLRSRHETVVKKYEDQRALLRDEARQESARIQTAIQSLNADLTDVENLKTELAK